ncbi:unnamed protein product, partial [Pylaiella littoralis]
MTQRFAPLSGLAWANICCIDGNFAWYPLYCKLAPHVVGRPRSKRCEWSTDMLYFSSPRPSELAPAQSMSPRTCNYHLVSTAVWPWKYTLFRVIISSLATAACAF